VDQDAPSRQRVRPPSCGYPEPGQILLKTTPRTRRTDPPARAQNEYSVYPVTSSSSSLVMMPTTIARSDRPKVGLVGGVSLMALLSQGDPIGDEDLGKALQMTAWLTNSASM